MPEVYAGREPVVTRSEVIEMLARKFEGLPDSDRKLFSYGSIYMAVNAGFAGLIANSLYRRALHVTQGRITSCLPMAFLPFVTTAAMQTALVTSPLLSGDLNCQTCALVRGAVVGVVGGGIYPLVLALPVNAGLATRYNSSPMPEKGNVLRFWTTLSRPIVRKMYSVFLLQALFGTFLSSKQFDIYVKMLNLPDSNREELQ